MTTLYTKFKKSCGVVLAKPSEDVIGLMMFVYLGFKNRYLEHGAVRLCELEPDHKILEIGFGPGHGIFKAYQGIKDGAGKVYGLDYSELIVEVGQLLFRPPLINREKVDLQLGTVMEMPYEDDYFDRIIHVNSFYYWPDLEKSLREIWRVLKPGGRMVTTMNRDYVFQAKKDGWARPDAVYDPLVYMQHVEAVGFRDVRMEDVTKGRDCYQAVICTK